MSSPSPNVWDDPTPSTSRLPSSSTSPSQPPPTSASSTKYGSIAQPHGESAKDSLLSAAAHAGADVGPAQASGRRAASKTRFHDSLAPRSSRGGLSRSRDRSTNGNDVFLSDEESDDEGRGLSPGGTRQFSRGRAPSASGSIWSRVTGIEDDEESLVEESDKQWGVLQMELIQRIRGKHGLVGIYLGVYLLSILLSLESNLSPTIEPYFLSLLNSHSLLASLGIVVSLAHAVGKPPITKILDVFGRAQGIACAAAFWFVGYMLTASAKSARTYIVARAFAALGAQGLGLAQQIVVADTSSLSDRALFTSTISLPWLVTTWIGPPIGAWFQRQGEPGYRASYALFGVLIPMGAFVLYFALKHDWNRTERALKEAGLEPPVGPTAIPAVVANASHSPLSSPRKFRQQKLGREARVSGMSSASRRSMRSQVEMEAAATAEGAQGAWEKTKRVWDELDVVGLTALTIGCLGLLLPLTLAARAPTRLEEMSTWITMGLGLVVLIGFGYYEWSWAPIPLLPPRLLQNRTILAGAMLGFFHFASCFAYSSFFTSFLQVARGSTPRDASYISESYIFAASLAAPVVGLLARSTHHYKWLVVSGVLIHMIGVLFMMRARRLDGATWEIVMSQILGGIGGAGTTLAGQLGCQAVVGHQDVGIATAIFLTVTTLGGAFGAAFAGSIWSSDLPRALAANLPLDAKDEVHKILESLPYALSFPVGSEIRLAINTSYVDVQQKLNGLAFILLIPALIAALGMRNVNLETEERRRQEGGLALRNSFPDGESTGESETSSLLDHQHHV